MEEQTGQHGGSNQMDAINPRVLTARDCPAGSVGMAEYLSPKTEGLLLRGNDVKARQASELDAMQETLDTPKAEEHNDARSSHLTVSQGKVR